MNKNKILGHIALIVANILIALSIISTKALLSTSDIVSILFFRFLIATVVMFIIIFALKKLKFLSISLIIRGLVSGFLYFSYFFTMFISLKYTTTQHVGQISTLVPLITAIFSIFLFKNRIGLLQLAVYFLALIFTMGVVLGGSYSDLFSFKIVKGDYIFLIAIFFLTIYQIMFRVYKDYDFLTSAFSIVVGGLFLVTIILFIIKPEINLNMFRGSSLFHMLNITIGATVITTYLMQLGVINVGAKLASTYIYMSPVIILLVNYIFYDIVVTSTIVVLSILTICITILLQYIIAKSNQ